MIISKKDFENKLAVANRSAASMGYNIGYKKGYKKGYEEGYEAAYKKFLEIDPLQEAILHIKYGNREKGIKQLDAIIVSGSYSLKEIRKRLAAEVKE